MKASPPGLFSTTTGWPHLADSLSANTRAVMSTPEPGAERNDELDRPLSASSAPTTERRVETSAARTDKDIKARIERRELSMDVSCDNCSYDEFVNGAQDALSSESQCARMQICVRGIPSAGPAQFALHLSWNFRNCTHVNFALPHCAAQRSFVARDQALAAAIPAAHDESMQISRNRARNPSVRRRFLLALRHINKGGTAVDLTLRLECARCMRRVRFCRRDLAGGILSSSGRRRRQTNEQLPV